MQRARVLVLYVLIGLLFAALAIAGKPYDAYDKWFPDMLPAVLPANFLVSLLVLAFIGWILVSIPIKTAGNPDDPAPPSAVM